MGGRRSMVYCVFQVGGLRAAVGQWFTPGTQLTLNNKIDGHQIN